MLGAPVAGPGLAARARAWLAPAATPARTMPPDTPTMLLRVTWPRGASSSFRELSAIVRPRLLETSFETQPSGESRNQDRKEKAAGRSPPLKDLREKVLIVQGQAHARIAVEVARRLQFGDRLAAEVAVLVGAVHAVALVEHVVDEGHDLPAVVRLAEAARDVDHAIGLL